MIIDIIIFIMSLFFEDFENGWFFCGKGFYEYRYLVFMCNIYLKWNINGIFYKFCVKIIILKKLLIKVVCNYL